MTERFPSGDADHAYTDAEGKVINAASYNYLLLKIILKAKEPLRLEYVLFPLLKQVRLLGTLGWSRS